MQPKNLKLV